jgi:hypothetical protein
VTPRMLGDIPGTTRRESISSRERRVSCSAIAEHGITKGRHRYTDCYAAIPIAGAVMQPLRGSCSMHQNLATRRRAVDGKRRRNRWDEVFGRPVN